MFFFSLPFDGIPLGSSEGPVIVVYGFYLIFKLQPGIVIANTLSRRYLNAQIRVGL